MFLKPDIFDKLLMIWRHERGDIGWWKNDSKGLMTRGIVGSKIERLTLS